MCQIRTNTEAAESPMMLHDFTIFFFLRLGSEGARERERERAGAGVGGQEGRGRGRILLHMQERGALRPPLSPDPEVRT